MLLKGRVLVQRVKNEKNSECPGIILCYVIALKNKLRSAGIGLSNA